MIFEHVLYCRLYAVSVVLADLLERAVLHLSSSPPHCFFPPAEYKGQCKKNLIYSVKHHFLFSAVP